MAPRPTSGTPGAGRPRPARTGAGTKSGAQSRTTSRTGAGATSRTKPGTAAGTTSRTGAAARRGGGGQGGARAGASGAGARSGRSGAARPTARGATARRTTAVTGRGRAPARPSRGGPPTRSTGGTGGPRPGEPERRQRWLIVVAALVLTVFVGRLVYVQVITGPALAAEAQAVRQQTSVQVAHRGDIVDVNGNVLATSVDRYTIVGDQLAIQSFRGATRVDKAHGKPVEDGALGIAQLLGPVLDEEPAVLAAKLNGDDRYVVLARDVVPEVQRAVADLGLQAYVRTDLTSKRTYPAGEVAGPLIGFVNEDLGGQGGLERAYDDLLSGTDGTTTYERGRDGVMIPNAPVESVPAVPGSDLRLTIDRDVQWKAEELLDKAVSDTGSKYGMAVVTEIATGDVLALADSGHVDPNDRSTAAVANGSRAVKDVFEPGSTGKVITMAAALEGGYWKPESQFEVPYAYTTPNGQTFHDSHAHPVQRLTLAGILAHSSNTGTVQIGEKIPPQVRYDYLLKFGFGKPTGLELPGQSDGLLPDEESFEHDPRTPYTILFGQGVAVNAVQATQVFSTVANGGVRVEPSLFAGSTAPDGTFTPAPEPERTRVVSEKTADAVMRMLESVTGDEGTAENARVPGYRVAGKTGTAQMWLPGGGTTYMASFIGVAPAEDPKYTVSVFLRSPQSSIYGGVVAAPVFSDLMGYTLQKMDVPPSTTEPNPFDLEW